MEAVMEKKIFGTFLIFFILSFIPVKVQARELILEDCLKIAREQNPEFLSYYENLQTAYQDEEKVFKTMLPTISITETVKNDFNDHNETYTSAINVSQTVFQGKALVTKHKMSQITRDQALLDIARQAQTLTWDVKKAWYELLKSIDFLEETEAALGRLEQHVAHSKQFFKEGRVWNNDVLQAEVKYARGEQDVISAKMDVAMAKANLNVLLNREIDDPVEVTDSLRYVEHSLTWEEVKQSAMAHRPDYKKAQLDVKNKDASVTVARAGLWPKVDLDMDIKRSGSTFNLQNSSEVSTAQLSMDWEVWNWGATQNAVAAAKAKHRQENLELRALRNQILLEVQEAWLSVREARGKVWVLKGALEQGEENYRVNEIRFQEKKGTATDVLDAQDLLTATRKDYIEALASYLSAIANLDLAIGKDS